jgi:hypothetical protein
VVGAADAATRVRFRDAASLDALLRGDHLALAEAFLNERIDVEESYATLRVTDQLDLAQSPKLRSRSWLRFLFDRRRFNRASIAFHYDRPADFFLSWLRPRAATRTASRSPEDDLAAAEARKLQYAIDALGLGGSRVLDMAAAGGASSSTRARAASPFTASRSRARSTVRRRLDPQRGPACRWSSSTSRLPA